jgi:hypothetical protein
MNIIISMKAANVLLLLLQYPVVYILQAMMMMLVIHSHFPVVSVNVSKAIILVQLVDLL